MKIETVAVIGAGLMGRGIAFASALGGFRTLIHDEVPGALDRAMNRIRKDLDEGVERGKVAPAAKDEALARVGASADFDAAVAGADFVIEAVPEDIGLKLRIFARLDMLCREHVVLATNTSALSVTEIAAAVKRPARVLGMHFFNPVPKMKLVEIVRALETGERSGGHRGRRGPAHGQGNGPGQGLGRLRDLARQRAHRQRGLHHAPRGCGHAPATSTRP